VLAEEIVEATDDERRDALSRDLERAFRAMLFEPRDDFESCEWRPLPTLAYVHPLADADATSTVEDVARVVFRSAVGGLKAIAEERGEDLSLVSLARFEVDSDELRCVLACPSQGVIDHVKALWAADRGEREANARRLADMDLRLRFGLPLETLVPVVLSYDLRGAQGDVMNQNHLADPDQFLSPASCGTTSGFLNMVGSLALKGGGSIALNNLHDFVDAGRDEWLRWFFHARETGVLLDLDRLLVNRADWERWAYWVS
jgi:hypothetical protein